jgi:hypothetical protein
MPLREHLLVLCMHRMPMKVIINTNKYFIYLIVHKM